MKLFKYLILTFFIISLTECAKNDSTDDSIDNFIFDSDKSKKSIFDKVQWIKIEEKNGITLFMQKNKNEKLNFYKAEKIINSKQGEKLFNNLMDFDKYTKIFPKTLIYKKIKDISKNKYLVYNQANFKPLKNRDYYIFFEYSIENKNDVKEWTIEKYPIGSYPIKFPETKGVIRVKNVYSRWKIIEFQDKVKISVEYYNNFNLKVSKIMAEPFEKKSAIEALNYIINFTK